MREYIEREAALKALCADCCAKECDKELCQDYHNISVLPAADVRPVVLCRDCKHRDPEDHKCDSGEAERQGCPFKVADNYFCAYGER